MAGAVKLEKTQFTVKNKTGKTGLPITTPTMEMVVECEGRRITKRLELRRSVDGSSWSYSYDMREAVSYLILGTTNARPTSKESRDHWSYAVDQLHREVRTRIRRFSKRKDVVTKEQESKKREERLALIRDLQDSLDKIVKRFPDVRKQDVLLCFERAKNKETVRQVMET